MHKLIQQHHGFLKHRAYESPRVRTTIPKASTLDAILDLTAKPSVQPVHSESIIEETPREIYVSSILADLKQVIHHMQEPEPPVDSPDKEPVIESPRRTLEELNEIREVNVRKRGRPPKVPALVISAVGDEEPIAPPSIKKTVSRVKKVIKANIATSIATTSTKSSTKTSTKIV